MNLHKINQEIELGLKHKASIRLRSMINSDPDNLELRNLLAQMYYDAGFFDAAGKFWLLYATNDYQVIKCTELYESSVNYSGNQILKEIKFRGDKNKLSSFAKEKLEALENDSLLKTGHIPYYQRLNLEGNKLETFSKPTPIINIFGCLIGLIIIVAIIIIFILGLINAYVWLF